MNSTSLDRTLLKIDNMECLLSVHSTVINRQNVPRIYLSNPVSFNNDALKQCVFASCESTRKRTVECMIENAIMPYMLVGLSENAKKEIIEILHHQINENFESGLIHYEMGRFTPFTTELCTSYISKFTEPIDKNLLLVLARRMSSSDKYINKFPDINKQVNSSPQIVSAYSQSVYEKIGDEWQKSWLSEFNYMPSFPSIVEGVMPHE